MTRSDFFAPRTLPGPGEAMRSVLFVARFGDFGPGEQLEFPDEEAHRLVWLEVAEALGFVPDPVRGMMEQDRRIARGV